MTVFHIVAVDGKELCQCSAWEQVKSKVEEHLCTHGVQLVGLSVLNHSGNLVARCTPWNPYVDEITVTLHYPSPPSG